MTVLPPLPGFTILHQHDTDEYCHEHEAAYPMAPKCSYIPTLWTRIKLRFRR